jgi:hypothetical protein
LPLVRAQNRLRLFANFATPTMLLTAATMFSPIDVTLRPRLSGLTGFYLQIFQIKVTQIFFICIQIGHRSIHFSSEVLSGSPRDP